MAADPTLQRDASPGAMVRATGVYWAAKALPGLVLLASTVVFVRAGGKSAYGVYTLAWSAATFAANLATGWQSQACLRFARGAGLSNVFLARRRSAWSVLIGSLVAPILFVAATGHLETVPVLGTYLLAVSAAAQTLILSVHQANSRPTEVLVGELARASLTLFGPLVVLLLVPTFKVGALLFGVCFAQAVSFVILYVRNRSSTWNPSTEDLAGWWRFGWPMGLWLAGAAALQFGDRFFIQHYLGSEVTGSYGAVYDLLNRTMVLIFFPITMATHPMIARLWNAGDRESALRMNRQSIVAQILIMLPTVAILMAFRHIWLGKLLDEQPSYASLVLPIALGTFTWQLALSVHKAFEMAQATGSLLLFLTGALITNFSLNWALVPRYGATASAWATLAASLVYFVLCATFRRRLITSAREEDGASKSVHGRD